MKQVVLATGNPGKLKEMAEILQPFGWGVSPQSDFFADEAEETGLSFIENAILKARFACLKTGLPAIADDSGLEVAALQGRPGIYSARYAGPNASDEANLQRLLVDMEGVPPKQRQASYYCAMVFCRYADDPTPLVGLGRWKGEILQAPQGDGGFGYDPIFWVPQLEKSAAQLSKQQKNAMSHRAQALKGLVAQIRCDLEG
ncbi:MAG: RdgB/HAM1 family non-canonical purine NTP pyrophosphatase [Thiomicrorhabdus chilensis]|uniref:RdgB/HAM1 family non-canonical purine NTP pyrophosphatase n=1 Tax=Thiomicrorhabdus chilensis TaxID=63656 RepID=UPI00299D4096|nr:RdgB/HAM1 family non-canonical purine NTP pyrophosphatase [Thiomicrorhabdus chilensis]MDX1347947.1 RdgB/HAM1 family non-canonical purine NTP pyrophosphatase [Thiomicrorhabdus chilensis]